MRGFILLMWLLFGCGKQVAPVVPDVVTPVTPPTPTDPSVPIVQTVALRVFSASWCQPCKALAKNLIEEFSFLPADIRARVSIELYVVSGARSSDTPTQKDADSYKARYLPIADKAFPDPGMKIYREHKAGDGSIPAAVLVKGDKVVGRPRSDAADIMSAILDNL